MNAPSSARSSKRSLRGRDTRQGTQFGRRGVGTGLGVSSAGDTNSWLWPASRASKSSKAIGPTGLFEGGAALKPARARAAMPKRGLSPGLPVSLLPKRCLSRRRRARRPRRGLALPNDCELAAAPLSCRIGGSTRAAAGRDPDLPIRSRGLALRRSGCGDVSRAWKRDLYCLGALPASACPGRVRARSRAPHRCATACGVVLASGRALEFCKARGFSSVRWRRGRSDKGLPKTATPAPAARSQRGGTRFFAARETQGSGERAGSAAEALQVAAAG